MFRCDRLFSRCNTFRSGGAYFSMFSFAGVKLWLNCQPGVLSWDLGHYFFGCCLVNSCGGGCLGESFGSVIHLGRSTMPGWYKVWQIGSLSSKSTCNNLLHLEFRVHFWLVYSCVQFAVPADWEAPGWVLFSQ